MIPDLDKIVRRRKTIRYDVVFGSGVWWKVANGGDMSIAIFVLRGGFSAAHVGYIPGFVESYVFSLDARRVFLYE